MSKITRRDFLKRSAASGLAAGVILSGLEKPARAYSGTVQYGTLIDLTRCDGCAHLDVPACVSACREENKSKFPHPVPSEQINNYWPQKKKEDWSDKKEIINRLTPYNWITVQKVSVEHDGRVVEVNIPRRCMHCDNPPCSNICPFGAQAKTPEGPVLINHELCFGGAKCRSVCPWGIPARQAGVGLYMKIAPQYLGGGVMYKCDLCYHRVTKGQQPACVESCPRGAIQFAAKDEIKQRAEERAKEINGFVYGDKENGGTSTFYVSQVPFEKIHQQLVRQKSNQPNPEAPGYPLMPVNVGNYLDTVNGLIAGMLAAPLAGAAVAGYTAYKKMKDGE